MTKEEFKELLETKILPLFTGSDIISEEESTSRDNEVAQGISGTVLVKPNRSDEYRFIIKRSQPFKASDTSLIRSIVQELVKVSTMEVDEEYKEKLQSTAIEKALCDSISTKSSSTILGVISHLSNWSTRTYEGNRLSFGIIINENEQIENPKPNEFYSRMMDSDFFAMLSDGIHSCVELDRNGVLMGYVSMERIRIAPALSPYEFINTARYCTEGKIGITLLTTGDILIFKDKNLIFACRHGVWGTYCHDEIIQMLSNRTSHTQKDIRKSIYFTALDCSFSYTGSCLVYLNKDRRESALNHIDIYDVLDAKYFNIKKSLYGNNDIRKRDSADRDVYKSTYEEMLMRPSCAKSNALNHIIAGKKFNELSRRLRQDVVAMDGATIIDYDGTIIAAGAIIKIEAGSSGGGRLAAAKTLAKYGVAIKVSVDGTMSGFSFDKKINKVRQIFTMG